MKRMFLCMLACENLCILRRDSGLASWGRSKGPLLQHAISAELCPILFQPLQLRVGRSTVHEMLHLSSYGCKDTSCAPAACSVPLECPMCQDCYAGLVVLPDGSISLEESILKGEPWATLAAATLQRGKRDLAFAYGKDVCGSGWQKKPGRLFWERACTRIKSCKPEVNSSVCYCIAPYHGEPYASGVEIVTAWGWVSKHPLQRTAASWLLFLPAELPCLGLHMLPVLLGRLNIPRICASCRGIAYILLAT